MLAGKHEQKPTQRVAILKLSDSNLLNCAPILNSDGSIQVQSSF